ncbi:RcnB family protein [Pseudomonas sp. JM0905a]|uniref:RcnB family protein n=1 Tax=Metapseudomonas resinovorans TaxID=53412 RepID=A0ABT4Y579_METRE|nr:MULTISPECIES: anti-virulence regulator CigR family protein [Pseudomonas]MBD2837748.1 RcnB family protein [Pseudomonas sp. JM0905a]MDA8484025.1 RcnB family protein [Pseudomonas resinovorans]
MTKTRTLIAALTSIALVTGSPALLADPGKGKGHDKGQSSAQGNNWSGGPQVDIGGIRVILDDNRDYWGPAQALPPGIQKNLARGKPLPPGIAKKLDGRLVNRLPHYEGYDWVRAGTDLILVAVATGIIYEVLQDVMD